MCVCVASLSTVFREAIDTSDTGSMLSPSTKSQGGDDMLQLELKLRVADSRYLIEELKKKERHVERANAEMFDVSLIAAYNPCTFSSAVFVMCLARTHNPSYDGDHLQARRES